MATSVDSDPPAEPPQPPPEDDGGQMTLLDHLLELRTRVTWMTGAIVVGMGIFFAPPINFAV
ncbi:MAG: twin-arginine translocase subunit TatC, partial [Chloroflexi bacterium]|nr:twin-arginine translocase subunit TatC [Chloroflexota bacterium]